MDDGMKGMGGGMADETHDDIPPLALMEYMDYKVT